jgi:hypothetical protein
MKELRQGDKRLFVITGTSKEYIGDYTPGNGDLIHFTSEVYDCVEVSEWPTMTLLYTRDYIRNQKINNILDFY